MPPPRGGGACRDTQLLHQLDEVASRGRSAAVTAAAAAAAVPLPLPPPLIAAAAAAHHQQQLHSVVRVILFTSRLPFNTLEFEVAAAAATNYCRMFVAAAVHATCHTNPRSPLGGWGIMTRQRALAVEFP